MYAKNPSLVHSTTKPDPTTSNNSTTSFATSSLPQNSKQLTQSNQKLYFKKCQSIRRSQFQKRTQSAGSTDPGFAHQMTESQEESENSKRIDNFIEKSSVPNLSKHFSSLLSISSQVYICYQVQLFIEI